MRCENRYCYYEIDGKCYFGDVIINEEGRCAICETIRPSEEKIADIKKKVREQKEAELRFIEEHTRKK